MLILKQGAQNCHGISEQKVSVTLSFNYFLLEFSKKNMVSMTIKTFALLQLKQLL